MQASILPSLAALGSDWPFAGDDPFASRAFLSACETHGAASPLMGWEPCHVALRDDAGALVGLLPLYQRSHSYGDFAWDFGWAGAWERMGLPYYPKLVTAIPYTPSPGPRLLVAPGADGATVRAGLIAAAIQMVRELDVSCWQCLFVTEDDREALQDAGLLLRQNVQYHWQRRGEGDFNDFLAGLTAKRRKETRRERRRVAEAGVELCTLHGDEIDDGLWPAIHRHYLSTFQRYNSPAAFSEDFFRDMGRQLGRRMVVFVAFLDGEAVASSICYRSSSALFGRHWGADREVDCLHFELCYYQGIDYCLREGLQSFEPGAGGEHKIARGFMPISTWSGYWIADPRLRRAVEDFLVRENKALEHYADEAGAHGPYKAGL